MNEVKLYKGDCLQVMQELINKGVKVDMILTDPPYGTTACKWDNVIPFDIMWKRIRDIRSLNTAIALFGAEPFSSMLRCSNIKEFKYDWIWEKTIAPNFMFLKKQPRRLVENVSMFYINQPLYNPQMIKGDPYIDNRTKRTHGENTGREVIASLMKQTSKKEINNTGTRYPSCILKYSNSNNKNVHPTQKPVALLEYLIKTYTNEGDTVLDFTMGSGSTGVACVNTGRKFIGIELDDKYFEIAESRIKEAVSSKQSTLF